MVGTLTGQSNDSSVNGQVLGKADQPVPIDLDQLDLAGETFLAGDFATDPAAFPFAPRGMGKGLQYGVRAVDTRNRSIKITKNLRHLKRPAERRFTGAYGLIVQHMV